MNTENTSYSKLYKHFYFSIKLSKFYLHLLALFLTKDNVS